LNGLLILESRKQPTVASDTLANLYTALRAGGVIG